MVFFFVIYSSQFDRHNSNNFNINNAMAVWLHNSLYTFFPISFHVPKCCTLYWLECEFWKNFYWMEKTCIFIQYNLENVLAAGWYCHGSIILTVPLQYQSYSKAVTWQYPGGIILPRICHGRRIENAMTVSILLLWQCRGWMILMQCHGSIIDTDAMTVTRQYDSDTAITSSELLPWQYDRIPNTILSCQCDWYCRLLAVSIKLPWNKCGSLIDTAVTVSRP